MALDCTRYVQTLKACLTPSDLILFLEKFFFYCIKECILIALFYDLIPQFGLNEIHII
ncbi:hypothetical protein Nmel_008123 [Mimus melanotis]